MTQVPTTRKQIVFNVYDLPTRYLERKRNGFLSFLNNSQDENNTYTVFTVVDAVEGKHSFEFIDHSKRQYVPKLGSQDIFRLGSYFSDKGYNVSNVALERISDPDNPVSREETDAIIKPLKMKKQEWKEAEPLLDQIFGERGDMIAVGVVLSSPDGNTLTVTRAGGVESANGDYIKFLELFTRAWYDLRLS